VALGKVTVANGALEGFGGDGIRICGGALPERAADVTGALVRNVVAVDCGGSGIRLEGRINKKPRVLGSVTSGGSEFGRAASATKTDRLRRVSPKPN